MSERVYYRLRTLSPETKFWDHRRDDGEWASEPFDDLLDAGREFVRLKGRGKLRIMREREGFPMALLYKELREVNEFIRLIEDGEEAKQRKAAA